MREKEQSLIAGLRAMNEPVLHTLRPLEETEQEEDEDELSKANKASDGSEGTPTVRKARMKSTLSFDTPDPNEIKLAPVQGSDSDEKTEKTTDRAANANVNDQGFVKRADSVTNERSANAFRSAILSTMASMSTNSDSSSQAGQIQPPSTVQAPYVPAPLITTNPLKSGSTDDDPFGQSTVASVKDWWSSQMNCSSSEED